MANIKFSAFTQLAPIDQTNSYIVGYEGDANTNNRWTFSEVASGLKAVTATPYSIYSASGTLEATREVTFSANDLKFIATGNGKLWYEDGNQQAGYVLKSDANGKASWAVETDTDTTYAISTLNGDNTDEEKIVLTAGGSGSGTSTVVLEAGTGLTVARSTDKITFTNSSPNQATPAAGSSGQLQYNNGSNGFAASANLTYAADTLTVKDNVVIRGDGSTNAGKLRLECYDNSSTHYVDLIGPDHGGGASSYSIKLPNSLSTTTPYASGGRILETDATGVLKWIDTSNVTGNLYTTDGTIISGRKAKLAGTFQFRNSGDNSDLLTLNTNGNFALGLNAGPVTDSNCVTIGNNAQTNGSSSISIGGATWSKVSGIAIGQTSYSAGTNISIGQQAGDYNTSNPGIVTIGNKVRPTGANSITLAARNSSASSIVPNVDNTFNVYLADASTVGAEDFQIVRSGESTLRTSLKVTGQAYTELNSLSNTLTVNWNNSNVQTISGLTGSHTFIPTSPKAGATYILTLIQTGAVTATWGSYIKWAAPDSAATPPALSGAGKTDVITLICWSATANSGAGGYYGSITKDLS